MTAKQAAVKKYIVKLSDDERERTMAPLEAVEHFHWPKQVHSEPATRPSHPSHLLAVRKSRRTDFWPGPCGARCRVVV